MRLWISHTLTGDGVSLVYVRIFQINLTQISWKLTEKCFSNIIKELLNWYWWILALVGFKMLSQERAFIQPIPILDTLVKIHHSSFYISLHLWLNDLHSICIFLLDRDPKTPGKTYHGNQEEVGGRHLLQVIGILFP